VLISYNEAAYKNTPGSHAYEKNVVDECQGSTALNP